MNNVINDRDDNRLDELRKAINDVYLYTVVNGGSRDPEKSYALEHEILKTVGLDAEAICFLLGIGGDRVENIDDVITNNDSRFKVLEHSERESLTLLQASVAHAFMKQPDIWLRKMLSVLNRTGFTTEMFARIADVPCEIIDAYLTDENAMSDADKFTLAMALFLIFPNIRRVASYSYST